MGLAERFPFDFAQGRLSTSGRDTRPAKASGTERTCFARENAKASRPSAPLGFAPFMEFFRASGAGSMTMQGWNAGDGETRGFPIRHEARRGALTKRRAGVNWRFILPASGEAMAWK